MTTTADYYDASYPPELWEAPVPPPVGAGAERSALEASSTVPPGTVLEAPGPDQQGQLLEVDPDSPVSGTLEETAADVPGGPLPDALTVTAGTPGTYDPAQTAAQRPRNVTELRTRATPADAAAWTPGQYVLVGENGKRAHWDGATWQRGEAAGTVPPGTVQ